MRFVSSLRARSRTMGALALGATVLVVSACKGRFRLPADARFVAEIGLGDGFGCARMKDGSVRCWGTNGAGELGDGTREVRAESVRVALEGGATELAVGGKQACAVARDLRCWGATASAAPPGIVPKKLAVGARHACALTEAGDVTCWGATDAGQRGGAETGGVVVHGATAIAAGGDATCAILRNGSLVCWGRLAARGLIPVTKIEGLADVTAIAVSATHVCAARAWGGVACFGKDEEGAWRRRLHRPRRAVDVVGMPVPARAVAVGRAHSCALLRDGSVHCWGANGSSQLADGTNAHRASPILVNGMFEVEDVAAAADATCARLSDGSERCWGGLQLPKTAGASLSVPTEVRW